MRIEYDGTAPDVSVRLPDRTNVAVRKKKLKGLSLNPTSLDELYKISEDFQMTKDGEPFLFYNSIQLEEDNDVIGRILIFASKQNLRKLKQSGWNFNCTFEVL